MRKSINGNEFYFSKTALKNCVSQCGLGFFHVFMQQLENTRAQTHGLTHDYTLTYTF